MAGRWGMCIGESAARHLRERTGGRKRRTGRTKADRARQRRTERTDSSLAFPAPRLSGGQGIKVRQATRPRGRTLFKDRRHCEEAEGRRKQPRRTSRERLKEANLDVR